VEDFSVAASPEDTANSIGACFLAMCRESKKNSGVSKKVNPLDSMYLGPEVTNEEISRAITSNNLEKFCNIQKNIEPEFIAARLAEGIVIGRCAERMEFGARSLGNRSILADPRNPEIVNRINKIIKMRDFWMPFAPVILDTYWEKYLVNKKGLFSPFMMIGFETTSLGRKDMPAAIHSADNTTRPQMLKENVNPDYYRIVSEFEKITGVGALLNTSFNLHGYPIVRTAEDAIDVFLNSHFGRFAIE
jgi:carbamoyltransferase